MRKNGMTVVDLFSGCGGFSEGFHLAGFDIRCAIDHWDAARKSIAMNHGEEVIPKSADRYNYEIDTISKLPNKEFNDIIPDTDIIIGSPPCISFSNSNRSGYADKTLGIRLIEAFMRIVARKKNQPNSKLKYWIMENVPNAEKFIENEYIFRPGTNNEYKGQRKNLTLKNVKGTNSKVYNMAEYGVPSKRFRYICGDFLAPSKSFKYNDVRDVPNRFHLGKFLQSLNIKVMKEINDPIWEDLSLPSCDVTDHDYIHEIAEWEWRRAKRLKRDKGYMGQMSFPENMDALARTIMAFSAVASREGFILPYFKNRYRHSTMRENATLMSFPINYQFSGISALIKKKQIGNAVPPKFSYELARAINGTNKPRLRRLKAKVNINGEFTDLKDHKFKIRTEPKRQFKIIFDQHIPYMKIKTYRVVLDNRESNWEIGKIKWAVSIHKGQGNYKILKPYLTFCKTHFTLSNAEKEIINKLKKKKGGPKSLHDKYRMPLVEKRNKNLLGPEGLLREIKKKLITPRYEKDVNDFAKIEKHNPKCYEEIPFKKKKDGTEYFIPAPVLFGYYILKLIMR